MILTSLKWSKFGFTSHQLNCISLTDENCIHCNRIIFLILINYCKQICFNSIKHLDTADYIPIHVTRSTVYRQYWYWFSTRHAIPFRVYCDAFITIINKNRATNNSFQGPYTRQTRVNHVNLNQLSTFTPHVHCFFTPFVLSNQLVGLCIGIIFWIILCLYGIGYR